MQHADAVVVGGGPSGASCAATLVAAGMDVVVVDGPRVPRGKPHTAWITPELVRAAALDLAEYGRSRALQPVRRFRVGWMGGGAREVDYREPVSFGVLRRELDAFLLERSRARVCAEVVSSVRRARDRWVVNERVSAPFLLGAGGPFCPVSRALGGGAPRGVAIALEATFRLAPVSSALCRVDPERPELDFTPDLDAYGWCFRSGDCLSVGVGRREPQALARELDAQLAWLKRAGRVPMDLAAPVRSHAYRVREGRPPLVAGDGALLVGDAAGLAQAGSGEGILPAVQSGQVAAEVVLEAVSGLRDAFDTYPARLARSIGPRSQWSVPGPLRAIAGRALLDSTWLTRHVVLDRLSPHRPAPPPALVGS